MFPQKNLARKGLRYPPYIVRFSVLRLGTICVLRGSKTSKNQMTIILYIMHAL